MKTVVKAFSSPVSFVSLLLALLLALSCGVANAQTYPSKPIKFIVGYPPGGGTDIIARLVAQKLSDRLGQPVVVDNKPGANAIIGVEYAAKAAPDGYTLLVGGNGEMVYNVGMYEHLPYDPVSDFVPITLLSSYEMLIAVHPSFAAASMKELIAMAKAKPGELFYATGAALFQVETEIFKQQAGVEIVNVPYKGTNAAVSAAVSGQVPLVTTSLGPAMAQLKAGKLRALAIAGPKRSTSMPNIPTMEESGVVFDGRVWLGLFAPAGTPRAITDKLYNELVIVLKDADLRERVVALGNDTRGMGMPPTEFAALLRNDLDKKVKATKAAHIKAD